MQLSPADAEFCNVIWGATLCCAVFVGATTSHQTWVIYGRNKKFNVFLAMVWFEFISAVITSVMAWMFLKGFIMPRSVIHPGRVTASQPSRELTYPCFLVSFWFFFPICKLSR